MVSQECLKTIQFQSHISILVNKSQSIVWNYFQNKKNYKYELRKWSFKPFDNSLGKHKYYIQQNEYYIRILKRKHKNYFQIKLQSVSASRWTLSSYINYIFSYQVLILSSLTNIRRSSHIFNPFIFLSCQPKISLKCCIQ